MNSSNLNTNKVCIIGCGNMGQAFLRGLLHNNITSPNNLLVFESDLNKSQEIKNKYQISVYNEINNELNSVNCLILAVKPQDASQALSALSKQQIKANNSLIVMSIMAGVSIANIKSYFSTNNIVRLMPNLPAQIGQAVTLCCYKESIEEHITEYVRNICSAIGKIVEVKSEELIDAGTAISGSGPAYFYYLVEAMIESAIKLGFNSEQAETLVNQTFLGASSILQNQNITAKELRANVTSKGGTTEAAINVFDNKNTKQIISDAIQAAFNRAKELSNKN